MKLYYPLDAPVHYTADLHLSHGNIMLYCRRTEFMTAAEREMVDAWYADGEPDFPRNRKPKISPESIARHDEGIIASINQRVPLDGVLAIVGDVFWQNRDENQHAFMAKARKFRSAIKCKYVHLVYGNHDPDCLGELFTWAHQKVTVIVRSHVTKPWRSADHVVLDHEAHWFWDARNRGSRHYYGHTHARGEEELDRLAPGRFSCDVGVDNAFHLFGERRPFSDQELEQIMSKRPGFGAYKNPTRSHA